MRPGVIFLMEMMSIVYSTTSLILFKEFFTQAFPKRKYRFLKKIVQRFHGCQKV